MTEIPVLDVSAIGLGNHDDDLSAAIADAASRFGFFQIVGHGIDAGLIDDLWVQIRAFFNQPIERKRAVARNKTNSRGYYDRELTKNARDQKEVFDFAHVPHPELADDHPANHMPIDGPNQWPAGDEAFRSTMLTYLAECERLAQQLLVGFVRGLHLEPTLLTPHFGPNHTSFIRLNHYPTSDVLAEEEARDVTPLGDMALHHHSDAGAFTILLQDDVGGLQVEHDGGWIDVQPKEGAFVVNTGDMMQVWSNDRYRAALHRVLPRTAAERYSVPYFFNPTYDTDYAPLLGNETPHYRSLNWGEFRKGRADGDYADYGEEVQISQYRTS